jgi:hypothetical protein
MRTRAIRVLLSLAWLVLTPVFGGSCLADESLIEEVRRHDSRVELRRVGLLGARLSHPQQLAASVGMIWGHQPEDFSCATACDFRGPLLQVEPGLAGTQISGGYGIIVGELGRNRRFLRRVIVGWAAKLAILRTYGGAKVEPPDQTFFGAEAEFTITSVNFRLGVFRSFTEVDDGDRWLVTAGIGWGF